MTEDRNRAAVLSRIRAALGVRAMDGARKEAVADRLRRHPRGTIPARARGDRETLIRLFATMLAKQGADVIRTQAGEDAVKAVAAELGKHDLPALLRLGSDPLLAALPWAAAPRLELRFGKAGPRDRAAMSRAVAAAQSRSRSSRAALPQRDARSTCASVHSLAGAPRKGKAPPGWKCTPSIDSCCLASTTKALV